MRRALTVTALAVALSAPIASASADSTVTVSGLDFPSNDTYLTYFGCEDLYHADTEPPRVRIDRGSAPSAGNRSFGVIMPGSGTASGPVHAVSSVADTTVASFSARARYGDGEGVAYVWYVTPGLLPGQVWAGHADLTLGSSWETVDTTAESYTWRLVTAATGALVRDGGTSTIADFTDEHGDGPGYLLAGFGCDGEEFSIDRLRYGGRGNVTTYDLEGIAARAEMRDPSEAEVAAGDPVTITGAAVDGHRVPIGASMVLQAKTAESGKFVAVGKVIPESNDGLVRKVVHPKKTTTYRWYLPAMGYADEAVSDVVTVTVKGDEPEPPAEPGESPSAEPTTAPGEVVGDEVAGDDTVEVPPLPTPSSSGEPSADPSDEPTEEASEEPTQEPTELPSEQPSEPPSDPPSDAPDSATP